MLFIFFCNVCGFFVFLLCLVRNVVCISGLSIPDCPSVLSNAYLGKCVLNATFQKYFRYIVRGVSIIC